MQELNVTEIEEVNGGLAIGTGSLPPGAYWELDENGHAYAFDKFGLPLL